ncbi:MAG: fasciclin domain-containing protein [Saprospirales bacterium]|nr:fasciclin domain-containing protein [Saprospirales bacterium]
MKKIFFISALFGLFLAAGIWSCQSGTENAGAAATASTEAPLSGQSAVKDDVSAKDVVKVAISSPDHTTLVAAVQAADLVDVLSNVGPFTVFAPTNAAFDALPAGTVEALLKPEKKEDLSNILQYHVTTSALSESMLRDGMVLGMADGGKCTIKVSEDGKIMINDAHVLGSVKASNGMVYVIDKVLLPK